MAHKVKFEIGKAFISKFFALFVRECSVRRPWVTDFDDLLRSAWNLFWNQARRMNNRKKQEASSHRKADEMDKR